MTIEFEDDGNYVEVDSMGSMKVGKSNGDESSMTYSNVGATMYSMAMDHYGYEVGDFAGQRYRTLYEPDFKEFCIDHYQEFI